MERSLELELKAEVRAREAKALCIVMGLGCVGRGSDVQTMLLDSSSMQDNHEEDWMQEEDCGEEMGAAISVENSKESSRNRRLDHITTSLGSSPITPSTASHRDVCQQHLSIFYGLQFAILCASYKFCRDPCEDRGRRRFQKHSQPR